MALALVVLVYIQFLDPRMGKTGYDEHNLPAIKVVVRNGCGIESLASDYANFIRDKNIDVLYVGDMPHPIYNKSLIEAKVDDRQDLQRLQNMTGITRYTLAVDPSFEAGFIIILGRDYEEFMRKLQGGDIDRQG
jgi:hypothetical protein